jgi:hypothetical protein
VAVLLCVRLGCFGCVMGCVVKMRLGCVGPMRCGFVFAGFMMLGSLAMVAGCVLMVLGRKMVVFRRFCGHFSSLEISGLRAANLLASC